MEPRGAGIILCSSRTKIVPRPLRHASCRAVAQSNPFRQLPLMLQRRSSLWLLYGPVAHFPASPGPLCSCSLCMASLGRPGPQVPPGAYRLIGSPCRAFASSRPCLAFLGGVMVWWCSVPDVPDVGLTELTRSNGNERRTACLELAGRP